MKKMAAVATMMNGNGNNSSTNGANHEHEHAHHKEHEEYKDRKCNGDYKLCSEREMKDEYVALVEHMRDYQSTMMVCSVSMKAMHYCVAGSGFYAAHECLEHYYKKLDCNIDAVAELLVMYDYMPIVSTSEAIERTWIPELELESRIHVTDAMAECLKVFDKLAEITSEICKELEKKGMSGSASTFADHYNCYVRECWKLKASIK